MKALPQFNKIYLLLGMQIFLSIFSLSFAPLFFEQQGYSLSQIILLLLLVSACSLILLVFKSKFNLRHALLMGFGCYALINLGLFLDLIPHSYILYFLFGSSAVSLFWIPINYLYFNSTQKENHGMDSSKYWLIGAILGVILPPLSAVLIKSNGYHWLFGLATLLYIIPLIFTYKFVAPTNIESNFINSIKNFKKLKTITLMEGAMGYFLVIIPIYVLLFITKALDYGLFLGYIGLVGGVASLIISHFSDKNNKRMMYLFPLFILMAVSIFGMYFIHNGLYWVLLIGIFSLFNGISNPLRLAFCLDIKNIDLGFWRARETFLNIGRIAVLGVALLLFYYNRYQFIFLLYGLIALSYPFLVRYKYRELK